MKRREFIAGLGGAVAWPLAGRAQQQLTLPVIGFLSGANGGGTSIALTAFRAGLGEQGYVEGRNVEILYQYAGFRYDRLPVLAAELVRRQVAVIVATSPGAASALAAKSATTTIPIVFAIGIDPVKLGLVASLSRPGSNITGASFLTTDLTAKRLELLHAIVPSARPIGFLVNPTAPQTKSQREEAEGGARILGVPFVILNASSPNEINAAFATIAEQRIEALLIGADGLFAVQSNQLAALAARYGVPAIYPYPEVAEAGGLIGYGASIPTTFRLAGTYVGRILKGEKPADLPVQQSSHLDLVLNLKTAKALGIEVPTSILLRADEVIE
jgi:putative tryptophan/tyrosine transport system substrate-binding protein